jgi:hypothetical protein
LALLLGLASAGCPGSDIVPLIGEDPEIAQLLDREAPPDPRTSPLAAARRLHQALVQQDADVVWALLAAPTRRALDERGALIGTSGRELLDAGTLPNPGGAVLKVRYDTVFFGSEVAHLVDAPEGEQKLGAWRLFAVSESGAKTDIFLLQEEDGWKLLKTDF